MIDRPLTRLLHCQLISMTGAASCYKILALATHVGAPLAAGAPRLVRVALLVGRLLSRPLCMHKRSGRAVQSGQRRAVRRASHVNLNLHAIVIGQLQKGRERGRIDSVCELGRTAPPPHLSTSTLKHALNPPSPLPSF